MCAKFNRSRARPTGPTSPINAEAWPSGVTYEGAPGYARDTKSELFLLAVANMAGENTFYEKAGERDGRFANLVGKVAVEDPVWLFQLLRWLRADANMRSAPIVGACAAMAALAGTGNVGLPVSAVPGYEGDSRGLGRALIDAVCQRADEPGELLAYWTSAYGRAIPKPVKRGLADAVRRLYDERSLLKYDTDSHAFRFADVIDLVHPTPDHGRPWQGDLFKHALDRRHGRDEPVPESLAVLRARRELMALPVAHRRAVVLSEDGRARLSRAGITWEALAGWLQGPMDADAWTAILPSMGYMAVLRNLRNFDEAGIPDKLAARVATRIADPDQVARSRQFPFRFFSAYLAAPSQRWGHALDKALNHATRNIPALGGRTLILVDTSGSMTARVSERSTMSMAQMAALFGVGLAVRGERVDLFGFANETFHHPIRTAGSVLREVERFCARIGEVGYGTDIAGSLQRTYNGHDRVIVLSDMQTFSTPWAGEVSDAVPKQVPIYAFNLAGYTHSAMPTGSGNRHELGGMTDQTFRVVPLIEAGRNATWPWVDTTEQR